MTPAPAAPLEVAGQPGVRYRETKHGTGQVQQPLEQVGPSFVADTEAATAEQPRERALHHPSMAAQPLAGVDASPGDSWSNAASSAAHGVGPWSRRPCRRGVWPGVCAVAPVSHAAR